MKEILYFWYGFNGSPKYPVLFYSYSKNKLVYMLNRNDLNFDFNLSQVIFAAFNRNCEVHFVKHNPF
jgi:hypothetical protein